MESVTLTLGDLILSLSEVRESAKEGTTFKAQKAMNGSIRSQQADSLIFQTEKQIKEYGDKIQADKKQPIEQL